MKKKELQKRLEALACWVNVRGNEDTTASKEYRDGYEDAMMDVFVHLKNLAPDWLDSWRAGVRKPL